MFHNKQLLEAGDQAFTVYRPHKFGSLKDFIIQRYPYDVEFLNDKVDAIYNLRPLPRAIVFTPYTNRTEKIKQYALQLKQLGKRFAGKLNFYLQDADSKTAKKFKFQGDATYIILDTDPEKSKYRYQEKIFQGTIDVNALIEFTQQFLDEKAPKYIRTAEVNKDDLSEPVYPVVAKTFNEVVYNPAKHVFLRFYDKMMQRYTEHFEMRKETWKVGKNFTDNKKNILIAEIETNDNDVPEYYMKEMNSHNHFFFMFSKKQKSTPIVYKGRVNATDMIKFINEIVDKEDKMKVDL